MLVALDMIDVDVTGSVGVVTVEEVVVVEDPEADEGVTAVVGVLVDEQELMNRSAAIATPGRLNDRKGTLSPFDSRRGLTGLPPFSVALPNIHFVVEDCVEYFRVSIFTQIRGTLSSGTRQPFHQSVRNPPTGSRDPLNRWDRRRHARTFPSNPFNRVSTEFRQSFKNPPTRRFGELKA